jgi:hypothetical protein
MKLSVPDFDCCFRRENDPPWSIPLKTFAAYSRLDVEDHARAILQRKKKSVKQRERSFSARFNKCLRHSRFLNR